MAVDLRLTKLPQRYDLHVVRGDSLMRIITIREKDTGIPVPLNGLSGKAQIRDVPDGPVKVELGVVVDQATTGSTVGQVTVTALATETRQLAESGIWDLQLTDGTDAYLKTMVQGLVSAPIDATI